MTIEALVKLVYQDNIQELLVQSTEDLRQVDSDGRSLLMHAILSESDNIPLILTLLQHGIDPNIKDKGQEWTALHFAARDQKSKAVDLLLSHGADPNSIDIFGNTPLCRAIMSPKKNIDVVQKLLAAGAKHTIKNIQGNSPYDIAKMLRKDEIIEIMNNV